MKPHPKGSLRTRAWNYIFDYWQRELGCELSEAGKNGLLPYLRVLLASERAWLAGYRAGKQARRSRKEASHG